jgi:hypothetical protein
MYASWGTDTTEINTGLYGDNFEISTYIDYTSKLVEEPKDDESDGL